MKWEGKTKKIWLVKVKINRILILDTIILISLNFEINFLVCNVHWKEYM